MVAPATFPCNLRLQDIPPLCLLGHRSRLSTGQPLHLSADSSDAFGAAHGCYLSAPHRDEITSCQSRVMVAQTGATAQLISATPDAQNPPGSTPTLDDSPPTLQIDSHRISTREGGKPVGWSTSPFAWDSCHPELRLLGSPPHGLEAREEALRVRLKPRQPGLERILLVDVA